MPNYNLYVPTRGSRLYRVTAENEEAAWDKIADGDMKFISEDRAEENPDLEPCDLEEV